MLQLRLTRLTRVVALVLLAWTAIDLTNSALCALEQEEFSTPVGSDLALSMSPASGGAIPAAPRHVDDCFCCSHCVTVIDVTPARWNMSVVGPEQVAPPAAPLFRTFPVYHPPQIFA